MALSRTLKGSFDFSQIKQNWMGDWNEGIIYKINDTVRMNGKAYVMNTTYHTENNLFGQEVMPGVDTANWVKVTDGSIYKGDWAFKDRHYKGDIVRYNGDFYQCVVDNFGGHPIYENGALTTKWTLIAKSSQKDKSKNQLQWGLYPPMGWTRNNCETNEMHTSQGNRNVSLINGNYEYAFMGRLYGNQGGGIGERDDFLASDSSSASGTYIYTRHAGFDFYDYLDGYRTTATGEAPRLIQTTGTDEYTFFLFDNGELYHTGYGGHGQNGDGTTNNYRYVKRVGRSGGRGTGVLRDVKVIKVAHSCKSGTTSDDSTHHCMALDDQGRVWTWGYNGYGQLGLGNTTNYSTPTQIPQGYFHNKQIYDIWGFGGNYQSSCAQTADGELYTWGYNGTGQLGQDHFRNSYRPERVKYNWQKYGGIKKVMCKGYGSECVIVVLCNDGSIHMCGNIGDGSYPIWGAGVLPGNNSPVYTPMAWLFYSRLNSLGIGNKRRDQGTLIDVSRNCDDMWVQSQGGAQFALIMKEKGTGIMYVTGINNGNYSWYQRVTNRDEYSGDNPMSNQPNLSFPAPLAMGNKTDIKYVQFSGDSSAVCFHNSDGTLWTTGEASGSDMMSAGTGANGPNDPTAQHVRNSRLPWESFHRNYNPRQPRFHEPISMLGSSRADGQACWGGLTSNSRAVFVGQALEWYYGWDTASNPSNWGWRSGNFNRTDL